MNIKSALRTPTLILLAGVAVLIAAPEAVPADTPRVSVSDARLVRPVEGAEQAVMEFVVTRTGDTGFPITFGYCTADGTAKAEVDYVKTHGVLTIPAGAGAASIRVPIQTGSDVGGRSFAVGIQGASGPLDTPMAGSEFVPGEIGVLLALGSRFSVDLNGDSLLDLVGQDGCGSLVVALRTSTNDAATPTFAPPISLGPGAPLKSADLNGDGKRDIIVQDGDTLLVALNLTPDAAPTVNLSSKTTLPTASYERTNTKIEVADFNGDGKLDLYVCNTGVHPGSPFQPGRPFSSILLNKTPNNASAPTFVESPVAYSDCTALLATDINRDGLPDLVLRSSPSRTPDVDLYVLANITAAGGAAPNFSSVLIPATDSDVRGFAVADYDLDGLADVSVSGELFVNATAPGGQLQFVSAAMLVPPPGWGSPASTSPARDFNADGRPDLVINGSLFLNTTTEIGEPSFAPPILIPFTYRLVTITRSTATGTILPNDGTVPDAFNFRDKRGVSTSKNTLSNTVTVAGLSADKSATLTLTRRSGVNTAFSINGGAYAKGTATVRNGDRVRLRNRVADGKTTAIVTVEIGGRVDAWTIRTGR